MDKNESRPLESYRTSWIVALFANIAADVDWRIPVDVVVGQGVRGKERRGEKENGERWGWSTREAAAWPGNVNVDWILQLTRKLYSRLGR